MKVVIMSNLYPPYDRGGAEQVVKKTVEGLLQSGHTVVVVTASAQKEEVFREGNLTLYRLRPRNIFFYTDAHRFNFFLRALWHICDTWNISTARRIREILQEEKPDIVHTHNLMGLGFLIPSVVRKLGIRHIHTVHDVQLVEPSAMIMKTQGTSWRYNSIFTRLYSRIMQHMIGEPNVVISPSQFLLDFYRSRGFFQKALTIVLRNPVTFPIQGKQYHKKPGEPFRFFYIGQIEFHKGILLLLEAFRHLTAENTGVELHIVGNGSLFQEVEAKVKDLDNVKVYGRLSRRELPELFQKMDVTVVPSLCYENSPTVIFESFASGVPVLASDIEGVAELIQKDENGITFRTGDVHSLHEAMKWSLLHQDTIQAMSMKTPKTLDSNSEETYINELQSIYAG